MSITKTTKSQRQAIERLTQAVHAYDMLCMADNGDILAYVGVGCYRVTRRGKVARWA